MKKVEYKWIALSCTSLGALFSVLSSSTLIIALPDIMKDLNANMMTIMWTVMIYMLALTILVPSFGRLADMIGRKKLYVWGFIVFVLGSLLCGFAMTGLQLILFRFIQSIGGALLVSNSAPIVADAFSKQELGKAMGINALVISIASVAGPILGGVLVNIGWRSIFFINIPIGIIGALWAGLQLKELDIIPQNQKFDWTGTLIFSAGMMMLLSALTLGGLIGWANVYIFLLFAASLIFIVLFVFVENKAQQPMLDLKLFKTRVLSFAFGSTLLNGIARGAVTFLLIFYFQGIKSMDPILAGVMLSPLAVSMMITSPVSGWLSDKYGSRHLSSIGLAISAAGLLGMMRIKADTSLIELSVWMFIMGFGSGMFFSPNSSEIMSAVPSERRGIAAGVRTMMNNAGSVISIAFTMAIVSSSISPDALQGLFTGTQVGSHGIAITEFIQGLRTAFAICFAASILAAFISYLRGEPPKWELKTNENA